VEIIRTLLDPAVDAVRFDNLLIISVAGDYAERAETEQKLSAALVSDNTAAAPYFSVIGRGPQVTRNLINTAIQNRGFDAVVFVREAGQDIPNLAPGRPTGRSFQLFLYDYDEFNRPARLPANSPVNLVVELYAAADEKKIWGIETLTTDRIPVTDVISAHSDAIATNIRKDGLVRN
jgi:hypothetical protein